MTRLRCSCGHLIRFPKSQQFSTQPICPKCGEVAPLEVELPEGYSEGSTLIYVSPTLLRKLADKLENAKPRKDGTRVLWANVAGGSIGFAWEDTE